MSVLLAVPFCSATDKREGKYTIKLQYNPELHPHMCLYLAPPTPLQYDQKNTWPILDQTLDEPTLRAKPTQNGSVDGWMDGWIGKDMMIQPT